MEYSLPEFKFSEFNIKIRLFSDSPFLKEYFLGAVVRGSIMFKAKELLCANPSHFNNCSDCILSKKCVYAQLFETQRPKDSLIMKKYNEIPHPFVMVPLIENEILNLRIVLLGSYIDYFPYFYLGLKSLESKKRYKILSIKNFEEDILINDKLLQKFTVLKPSNIYNNTDVKTTIQFVTPLHIKFNGKGVGPSEFKFTYFFRNLIRRLSLISYFYGNSWQIDFKELISKSETVNFSSVDLEWVNIERYSLRSKTFMPMGGVKGEVVLSTEAMEFYPFIAIGQYIQLGKNTSFGYGYYILK